MTISLTELALRRIRTLGQEVFSVHEDLMKWKPEPFTTIEKTEKSVFLKFALKEQRQWIDALLKAIKAEGDK